MMTQQQVLPGLQVYDIAPVLDRFRAEVVAGLQQLQKEIPCKYLYDAHGSYLFDQICMLHEYYPTRTEIGIMRAHVHEIAALLGRQCMLIEYGSGSSIKSRILLDALLEPAAYIPVDISREHLLNTAARLGEDYPELKIVPVCADYTRPFDLPRVGRPAARRSVYFPGSTIGNCHPDDAIALLQSIAALCGPGGGLLIGVDLKKDPEVLHSAYNDCKGVTADFNLNLLTRINRELGADFQCDQYRHYAFYNPYEGRMEMHLVSLANQWVQLDGCEIPFSVGETIWTESSYKYTPDEFARLAEAAGFEVTQVWMDEQRLFSVQFLSVRSSSYLDDAEDNVWICTT